MMCRGGAARHTRHTAFVGGPRRSPVYRPRTEPATGRLAAFPPLWPITCIIHHEACSSVSSDRARKKKSNGNIFFCVPPSRMISVLRCAALYSSAVNDVTMICDYDPICRARGGGIPKSKKQTERQNGEGFTRTATIAAKPERQRPSMASSPAPLSTKRRRNVHIHIFIQAQARARAHIRIRIVVVEREHRALLNVPRWTLLARALRRPRRCRSRLFRRGQGRGRR